MTPMYNVQHTEFRLYKHISFYINYIIFEFFIDLLILSYTILLLSVSAHTL